MDSDERFLIKAIFLETMGAALEKYKEEMEEKLTYGNLMRHTQRVEALPSNAPNWQKQFSDLFMNKLLMKVRKYS